MAAHCAVVPSEEVLELAAELQVLGGSDVDVGRGWAGAALSAAAASSSSPQLDAACDSWPALMATLHCKLYAWLQRGFSATALLLGGSSSGGLAAEATAVARQVAAVAFYAGCSLGLSWRLIAGDTVRDAMGSRQLPPAGRPQSAAQRPTSRLGKAAAAADGEEPAAQPCTIHAANPDELAQLLALAEQQLQAAAAAAGDGQAPPALVLSLALQAPGGQAAAVLHVLQLPQCAGEHQAQLCKLLQEVADLHRRGRAGEHLLGSSKLSLLNQIVAPLVAGSARLFVAAHLAGGRSQEGRQQLLPVLAAVQHVQAVCTKGAAAAASLGATAATAASAAVAPPANWVPCQQLVQHLEQRRQAQQQREAKAAALAAAEADRRERLQQAAKERLAASQGGSKAPAPAPGSQRPAAAVAAPKCKQPGSSRQTLSAATRQQEQKQQQAQGLRQPAGTYQPVAYGSPAKPEAAAAAEASLSAPEDPPSTSSSPTASLQHLRQQFQNLLHQTVDGDGHASPSAAGAATVSALATAPAAASVKHQNIAAGVEVADDIAMHVAALRMQAAAEARRALQAQQVLPGGGDHRAAASPGDDLYGDSRMTWAGSSGSSSSGGSRSGNGGGLGLQLEQELLLLQRQAVLHAASPEGAAGPEGSSYAAADLADLDGTAPPSLGSLYRQPSSRMAGGGASTEQHDWWGTLAAASEQQESPAAAKQHDQQHDVSWAAESPPAARQAGSPLSWPVAAVSDVFQSDNSQLCSPGAAGAGPSRAEPHGEASSASSWHNASSGGAAGSSRRSTWQEQSIQISSSYAAAHMRRQPPAPRSAAGGGSTSRRQEASQQPTAPPPQLAASSALVLLASESCIPPSTWPVAAAPAEVDVGDVAALLEDLQREQRLNSALLQQLHEVQRQLEETCATAAAALAAQQPRAPGVEDPADFNGLLAALQLERQQHSALRQQLLLERQQAEEERLALEAQLGTQHRQLLVAASSCRAWEQQTPLAPLFRRVEAELQRAQVDARRLAEENAQLAGLLAEADLERLTGAAQQLGEDQQAVCRELHRKLVQAEAKARKLTEERAALQKQLQGAERRDRLAELCRRQAESGAKTAAELRQQLSASQRQQESQSLAAAAAAAEAQRLRGKLQQREEELGRALADRSELQDTVESLRSQVSIVKTQLGRTRVLQCMQAPGC